MTHSRKKLVVAIAMIGATYASAVHAADDDATAVERVEVTGSNIKRLKNQGALPVTSIKTEDLTKQGYTTAESVVQSLAANTSSFTSTTAVGADTGGAAFADLRGLGQQYTLVLLDGRRLANQAIDGTSVDLNAIPLSTIDHIDILRDGASAIYGTDAIGGVINFVTKKAVTGVTLEASGLLPQHAMGKQGEFSITAGKGSLADDGWNVYGTIGFQKTQQVMTTDRGFAMSSLPVNGTSNSTSPANYLYNGTLYNSSAPGCVGGTGLIPNVNNPGACREQTSLFTQIQPEVKQWTWTAKGTKQFGDDTSASLQYVGTRTTTDTLVAPTPLAGALTMSGTNPNYPAGLDGSTIDIYGRSVPLGDRGDEYVSTTQRLLASVDGEAYGWNYRGGISYSQNEVTHDLTSGYLSSTLLQEAVDAGTINPFSTSSAGWSSVAMTGRIEDDKYTTAGVDFNVNRQLFNLPAGAVSVSFGGEARHDKLSSSFTGLTTEALSSGLEDSQDTSGSRNVQALTAEMEFPILKSLTADIAIRDDHYSDVGNTFNPKVSLLWTPTKELLFRAGASTGFRAPSLYNMYMPNQTTYTSASSLNDPLRCPGGTPANGGNGADCDTQFMKQLGGNTQLTPEKSSTITFGIGLEPTPSLTMNADFYWTFIKHTIGVLSENTIFDNADKYADLFIRNADGSLDYISDHYQNLGNTSIRGVDLNVAYRFPQSALGNFSLSVDGSYINKFDYQHEEGGEYFHGVGTFADYNNAPIFRYKQNAQLKWSKNNWSSIIGTTFQTGYHDEDPSHDVATYTLWNTSVSYVWQKSLTLTASIRNVFDKKPPYSNEDVTFQQGYDPRYTDSIGRAYYLQASYKM